MNRFFSKLDLRDIRIDPKSSRFPPEGDDAGAAEERPETTAEFDREDAPVGADGQAMGGGYAVASDGVATDGSVSASELPNAECVPPLRFEPRMAQANNQSSEMVADDVLKVSARSRPSAVAGAIAGVVRDAGRAEVQAIGAGATNQAVKAVAIARDYLQENGIDAICLPAFIDVTVANEGRTAIRLVIEPR